MQAKNIYLNSPVQEAIIDIAFETDGGWDQTLPGILYSKVSDRYPRKKQTNLLNLEVRKSEAGIAPIVNQQARAQFWSEDELNVIQLGPGNIIFNRLRPYDSWDNFVDRFKTDFSLFLDLAHPVAIKSVKLQYLNRPDIVTNWPSADKFFNIGPQNPFKDHLAVQLRSFLWGIEVDCKNDTYLTLECGNIDESDTEYKFRMDITAQSSSNISVELADVITWLNGAHESIETAFESSITEEARRVFNNVAS